MVTIACTLLIGYLTVENMEAAMNGFLKVYPKVDRATLERQYQHTWKVLYNRNQEVPQGRYRNKMVAQLINMSYTFISHC